MAVEATSTSSATVPSDMYTRLKATRSGYLEEITWHRFLVDSYEGGGGYCGKIKQPDVGYWGWAAEAYSATGIAAATQLLSFPHNTYLDRFPREDDKKFQRRCDVAHYTNYQEAILDLYVSYLLKRPMERAIPQAIEDWLNNVDGKGTSWDELVADVIAPRTANLGWMPVLFDMTPTPAELEGRETITKQEQLDAGIQPRAIPLFPANLLAWSVDEAGHFTAVKIRTDHVDQTDLLAPPIRIERYAIWTRENVRWWDVRIIQGQSPQVPDEPKEAKHPFKQVPVAIFRRKPKPDDQVKGISLIAGSAVLNRRHFNLVSELDEHLRGQVFAILQVPVGSTGDKPSEIIGGTDNCLPVPMDASQGYAYISPDPSIAATYEKRIEVTVQEQFRIVRLEYSRPTGGATSGVAHAFEFEATNRTLADFSAHMARGEAWSFSIVAPALHVGDKERDDIRISGATEFDVEDLAADLDNVQRGLGLGLGPTANKLLRLRTVNKILPNLDDDDRDDIEAELEEAADREADMAAMTAEIDASLIPGQDDPNAPPAEKGGDKPPAGEPPTGEKVKPAPGKRPRRNGARPPTAKPGAKK